MILERIEASRFSRVLRGWEGRTAVLLAGGPSLVAAMFDRVRIAREADLVRVVAINDSYLAAPWADLHYAADAKWHRWHAAGIAKPQLGLRAEDVRDRWAAFTGEKCTIQNAGGLVVDDAVHVLRNAHFPLLGHGLSTHPEQLVTGRHSGFQALNLAILAGATRVLLLGYDGRRGPNGEAHWHGDHPEPSPCEAAFPEFRRAFSIAERSIEEAGVTVVNCSPGSAIDSFPKIPLEDALPI